MRNAAIAISIEKVCSASEWPNNSFVSRGRRIAFSSASAFELTRASVS